MRLRLAAVLVFLFSAASVPAFADSLFTIKGGGDTITFALPSAPSVTGSFLSMSYADFNSVIVTVNGVASSHNVDFFSNLLGSGLFITGLGATHGGSLGIGLLLDQLSLQLFSGSLTDPKFKLGTYKLSDDLKFFACGNSSYTLTISNVAAPALTPEPSTLILLGTGALGAFGMLRRRALV